MSKIQLSIIKSGLAIASAILMVSCGSQKMMAPKISANHDVKAMQEGDVLTLTTTGTKGAFYKWSGPNGMTNTDSTSNTWTIKMNGSAQDYSGEYKVMEYMMKGNAITQKAMDSVLVSVKPLQLCYKASDTKFAFKTAGKYKITIKDVDIQTTTLTGYSLCLKGDNCQTITPNNDGPKCYNRPSEANTFTVVCSGDCPFTIVRTELHGPG